MSDPIKRLRQGEGALMQLVAALDELRATPSPEEQGK
jgi:hypothetical protein